MGKSSVSGPALVALTGGILVAASLALTVWLPDPVEAVRQIVRLTARSSLLLFLLAYTASALAIVAPSGFSRWQAGNRRWLGLSFALSHALHGIAVAALATLDPALFWTLTNPGNLAGGGLAYGFIALMAATSWDGAVRRLGRRRWGLLHTAGLHYIWLVFLVSYGKRVAETPGYAVFLALLLGALALRVLARRRSGAEAAGPRPV